MNTAAVIVAAGLPKYDSVPAAMFKVGTVTSAQHVIASIQKAGVSAVFLAVDTATKKLEKQLNSSGAFFIRTAGNALECAKQAIVGLPRHYDRVLLCRADRPLVMPETLNKLLSAKADIAVLGSKTRESAFCLLSMEAAEAFCADTSGENLFTVLENLGYKKTLVESRDSGLFTTARKAAQSKADVEEHQDALTRPLLEISVSGERMILDPRLMRLLGLVKNLRSVRDACEMCGISYSIAWNLLNAAEDELGYPLVKRNQGGRSGSGSELTEKGSRILEAYTEFEKAMNEKMQSLYEDCFGNLI